jgi:copper(I)-binding protein
MMKKSFVLNLFGFILVFISAGALADHKFKLGQLTIDHPYTRSTAPGQKVAGGFMKIENKGATDQLVSASSPVAGEMQLHTMTMDGNVMKMREVKTIEVPANGSVHLMFMDIKAPLKAGESVPVKLKFQKAGEVEIKVPVRDISGGGHMKH